MSDANVTRLGQINGSGDVDATFAKIYAGEVLTAFETATVMADRHLTRSIDHGKSAAFPATGLIDAYYHTPGKELLGQKVNQNEVLIHIDDLLVSDAYFANIDEAKNHYDMRSIVTTEQGRKLAKVMDRHILQVGVLAARATNAIPELPGGSVIKPTESGMPNSADFRGNGDHLAAALFAAAASFDEKDVPEEDRYCFVRPQQYYKLVQAEKTINRDFGGAGAYSDGKVYRVAGIEIVKTNNLPSTNITEGTEAGTAERYAGDFSNTVALIMQKQAVGTVKLLDLGLDAGYDPFRQAHFVISKYAVGHGILRPQASIEISADAGTGG
ncbi:phage capsid protein [Brucella sp. 10RB9213]|uniref:phage capsid protein n=1 Tax=Brucella sp. 10RB9213 TaxID=1844039 RepID=UPI0012ADC580|nr:phage capsid protein [Brucella sp. 10RB9213]MRN66402.1 capsid protein [Brucella sp. 10RB9213]